jgi:type IV pilus assembly protein PilO
MDLDSLRNFKPEDILILSKKQKIIGLLAAFITVFSVYAYFDVYPDYTQIAVIKQQENTVRGTIVTNERLAANLPEYTAQIAAMKKRFSIFLTELPNKTQIPSLLASVTFAGKATGLTFLTFAPKAHIQKPFFTIIPVAISVRGTYTQIGNFLAQIAALPRIATVTDFTLTPESSDTSVLVLTGTLNTYMYHSVTKKTTK